MFSRNHPVLSGQTIVEVLVAVALASLAFVGLLALGGLSVKTTSYSRNQNQATFYSSQVPDWLRDLRSLYGWEAIADKFTLDATGNLVTYCLTTLPTDEASFRALSPQNCLETSVIPNTVFLREVQVDLSNLGNKSLNLTVNTSWVDNSNPSAKIEFKLDKTQ